MNKKLLIGGAIVVAALGGYFIYRNYKKKSQSNIPPNLDSNLEVGNVDLLQKASQPEKGATPETPKPSPSDAPKPTFGMGSLNPSPASTPAPELFQIQKYKSKFPLVVNPLTGFRRTINIPANTEFEGKFIKMNDEDTGSFEGRYRGQLFLTTLSKSNLTKL